MAGKTGMFTPFSERDPPMHKYCGFGMSGGNTSLLTLGSEWGSVSRVTLVRDTRERYPEQGSLRGYYNADEQKVAIRSHRMPDWPPSDVVVSDGSGEDCEVKVSGRVFGVTEKRTNRGKCAVLTIVK